MGSQPERSASSSTFAHIRSATRPLIGVKCWKAYFAYGDELRLFLGGVVPALPPLKQPTGDWVLVTRASYWKLVGAFGNVVATSARKSSYDKVRLIEGLAVEAFEPRHDAGLWVILGDRLLFEVDPSPRTNPKDTVLRETLSTWELFAPDGKVIVAEPDGGWTYVDAGSRVPEDSRNTQLRTAESSAEARLFPYADSLAPASSDVGTSERRRLEDWLVEALAALGGTAPILAICKAIWESHQRELRADERLFFTWQYEVRWAATALRKRNLLRPASESPGGVWQLAPKTR